MRGSPLLRFIILVFALAATGVGLQRITSASPAENRSVTLPTREAPVIAGVPYRLVLSAPAAEVEIDTGCLIRPAAEISPISGMLEIDPQNPRVGLVVRWKHEPTPGEHRFAKLTLEPPGQATFTHVFDAAGDIDELFELPIPAAK